jgi:hypothetical protein
VSELNEAYDCGMNYPNPESISEEWRASCAAMDLRLRTDEDDEDEEEEDRDKDSDDELDDELEDEGYSVSAE